jgi:hypothetical protein
MGLAIGVAIALMSEDMLVGLGVGLVISVALASQASRG